MFPSTFGQHVIEDETPSTQQKEQQLRAGWTRYYKLRVRGFSRPARRIFFHTLLFNFHVCITKHIIRRDFFSVDVECNSFKKRAKYYKCYDHIQSLILINLSMKYSNSWFAWQQSSAHVSRHPPRITQVVFLSTRRCSPIIENPWCKTYVCTCKRTHVDILERDLKKKTQCILCSSKLYNIPKLRELCSWPSDLYIYTTYSSRKLTIYVLIKWKHF